MTPGGSKHCTQDIVAGALFLAVGGLGALGSLSYPLGTAFQMGPGYFPLLVFAILAVLGAALLVKGLLAAGPGIEGWARRPALFILGSLVLFALAAQKAGFVASAFGLALLSTFAGPGMLLSTRLALAALLTAFCWLVFVLGLGVLIPTWPEPWSIFRSLPLAGNAPGL